MHKAVGGRRKCVAKICSHDMVQCSKRTEFFMRANVGQMHEAGGKSDMVATAKRAEFLTSATWAKCNAGRKK